MLRQHGFRGMASRAGISVLLGLLTMASLTAWAIVQSPRSLATDHHREKGLTVGWFIDAAGSRREYAYSFQGAGFLDDAPEQTRADRLRAFVADRPSQYTVYVWRSTGFPLEWVHYYENLFDESGVYDGGYEYEHDVYSPIRIERIVVIPAIANATCFLTAYFILFTCLRILWRGILSKVRASQGRCEHCGYDLRGTSDPRCPECGCRMQANCAEAERKTDQ